MKKFDIFVWSSDFESHTGEGLLARSFLKEISVNSNYIFKVVSNNSITRVKKKLFKVIRYKKYNNNFWSKYILLFYGLGLIWHNHLSGKKTFYLNYLPLWNFLIFFILPKKTILGPVTGGVYYNSQNLFGMIIRKYLFPLFYQISLKFVFEKNLKVFFSTGMLRKFIKNYFLKRCFFNTCFITYNKRKIYKKKDIDFLFYYRNHSNKSNVFLKKIILNLKDKFKIFVVGDNIDFDNIKNLGNIKKDLLMSYLDRAKYSINSGENFYTLFAIDCIASDVKVFYNKNIRPSKIYFDNSLVVGLNFNNFQNSLKKIILSTKVPKKRILKSSDKLILRKITELKQHMQLLIRLF